MPRDRAVVVRPGEGRQLSLGSSLHLSFKADEAEAGGDYSMSVATVAANQAGTTPHVHREHDDITFVIEGALTFRVEEETFEASAGSFVLVPRGLAHAWSNPHPETATFLNVHIPGCGFEDFVRELATLSAEGHATPQAMAELGARCDVFFDTDALGSRYDH